MSATKTISDADIDRSVTRARERNPRAGRKAIDVSVKHGVAAVTGLVDSCTKKNATRGAARRTTLPVHQALLWCLVAIFIAASYLQREQLRKSQRALGALAAQASHGNP